MINHINNLKRHKGAMRFIAGLVLLLIYFFLMLSLSQKYIGNDEASYAYDAKLIMENKIPLKDFITRSPSVIYFYALFLKIFGVKIISLKIVNALIATFSLLGIYLIGKKIINAKLGLLAAFLYATSSSVVFTNLVTSTNNLYLLYTIWAMYFLISAEVLYRTNGYYKNLIILGGLFSALALFARQTFALVLISLIAIIFINSLKNKQWRTLTYLICSISLPSLGILLYFSNHIGFYSAFSHLTGIIAATAQQNLIDTDKSLGNVLFAFLVSLHIILPGIAFLFFKFKENFIKNRGKIYLVIWLVPLILVYFLYIFKRGFMFIYFSELIPALSLSAAIMYYPILSRTKFSARIIFLAAFIILVLSFNTHEYNIIASFPEEKRALFKRIGSGVSPEAVRIVSEYIKSNTTNDDVILSGSLQWSIESGRRQFLDLSRPLAYENDSQVYTHFNAPLRDDIKAIFNNNLPALIIKDAHFNPAFSYLKGDIDKNYVITFKYAGVKIYKRK